MEWLSKTVDNLWYVETRQGAIVLWRWMDLHEDQKYNEVIFITNTAEDIGLRLPRHWILI